MLAVGFSRGGHAFVSRLPGLGRLHVRPPGGHAGAAACFVVLDHLGDHLGKQVAPGAFGLGVHGAGPLVVVQDLLDTSRESSRNHREVRGLFGVLANKAGVPIGLPARPKFAKWWATARVA
jgi:hypothetical protein